jgi:tetrahydromethanopterin S-methyltransferase subunit G
MKQLSLVFINNKEYNRCERRLNIMESANEFVNISFGYL